MKTLWRIGLSLLMISPLFAAELLPVGSESRKFLNFNLHNKSIALSEFVAPKSKNPKPVVLSFWALWCAAEGKACAREMPLVQAWAEKNKDKVELFFINIDGKGDVDKVREYVEQSRLGGTVLLDFYQTTGKAYGVCEGNNLCKVPSLFVIAPNGLVSFSAQGFDKSAAELEEILSKAAFATPVPPTISVEVAPAEKFAALHTLLVGLNTPEQAKKVNLTSEQLLSLLKEAESAAKKQWGL
jgi:thiol-disulfide isomerase/thioredoxin